MNKGCKTPTISSPEKKCQLDELFFLREIAPTGQTLSGRQIRQILRTLFVDSTSRSTYLNLCLYIIGCIFSVGSSGVVNS